MLILLPIAAWILLLLLLRQRETSWRRAYLGATLIWGILLTLITEGLSLFQGLQLSHLGLAWGSIVLGLGWRYGRSLQSNPAPFPHPLSIHDNTVDLTVKPLPWPRWMLLVTGVLVLLVGITALVAPPNNWDAMAYHLPRVMHWMQNRSVGHYPTNYLPQLYQSPWSEFGVLHLQVLAGSDRFANLLQWSSLVGCLMGTSLIAQVLGCDRRGQALTMVLVATLPMAVLQGSNTKNDLVVAFWLVCLAYYTLSLRDGEVTPATVGGLGGSLGLALLTKGTAYVFVVPFLVLALIALVRHRGWKSWQPLLAIALLALLLNLGHYSRNLELFGTPLASGDQRYTNELVNLDIILSNLLRNVSLHLLTPFTSEWNQGVAALVEWVHQEIRLSANDPATTWPGTPFDLLLLAKNQNEDTVGNPGHFLIGIVTLFMAILAWGGRRGSNGRYKKPVMTPEEKRLSAYSTAVLVAFFLFCVLLKWQPWHSRLHLPLFVLIAPYNSAMLLRFCPKRLSTYLAIFLVQLALFWICFNQARPLIANQSIFNSDRISLYFHNHQDLERDYRGAIASIQATQCPQIGLQLRADILEYPIWVLFSQNQSNPPRLQHLNVKNASAQKYKSEPFRSFLPCANMTIQ